MTSLSVTDFGVITVSLDDPMVRSIGPWNEENIDGYFCHTYSILYADGSRRKLSIVDPETASIKSPTSSRPWVDSAQAPYVVTHRNGFIHQVSGVGALSATVHPVSSGEQKGMEFPGAIYMFDKRIDQSIEWIHLEYFKPDHTGSPSSVRIQVNSSKSVIHVQVSTPLNEVVYENGSIVRVVAASR